MFAYCLNNPVSGVDSEGTFFFTALGAATGFLGSVATSLLSGNDLSTAIDDGVAGAVGGAIAGAGIDIGLLIVGSGGAAAPAVAFALAYVTGGLGNVVTTAMSAKEPLEPVDYIGSFILGGSLNCLSLATSLTCAGKTLREIIIKGSFSAEENAIVGASISTATSIATGIATARSVATRRMFEEKK